MLAHDNSCKWQSLNHNCIPCEQSSTLDEEVALWSTTLKNVDSWTLPSRCRRICWVFVTTNNWLGLFSITLLRHLTHSKTTAQACSSVMGALNPLVIFSRDKQPSWVSWNGVQLVSLYFTFDEVAMILSNYGDCFFKLYFVSQTFDDSKFQFTQKNRLHAVSYPWNSDSNWVRRIQWQVAGALTRAVIARRFMRGRFQNNSLDSFSIRCSYKGMRTSTSIFRRFYDISAVSK